MNLKCNVVLHELAMFMTNMASDLISWTKTLKNTTGKSGYIAPILVSY